MVSTRVLKLVAMRARATRLVAAGVLVSCLGLAACSADGNVVLPSVSEIWGNSYSLVLLLKIAALVIPLALAAYNRAALRRRKEQPA